MELKSATFDRLPALICDFHRNGRTGGNLPNQKGFFEIFGPDGPQPVPLTPNVRHKRPQLSTNSFTHVIIFGTSVPPKGTRNRRSIILHFVTARHRHPAPPTTPRGPTCGFLADFFCMTGGFIEASKRGKDQPEAPRGLRLQLLQCSHNSCPAPIG